MQKVGLSGNSQFYSIRKQWELVSLTWMYCICHYSSGEYRWHVDCFIFLLSLASAKPQLPKPLNKFIGIWNQNRLVTNNGLYQPTKSATWRPSSGLRWFYTAINRLYDSAVEFGLFNWTISWVNMASITIHFWFP